MDGAQGIGEDGEFFINWGKVQGAQDGAEFRPHGGGIAQDADGKGGVAA
jgi:hypothetical protein